MMVARQPSGRHGTLSEIGTVVVSSTIAVGPLDRRYRPRDGGNGQELELAFLRFADDLMLWVGPARV
jgi:hypothetical protein